MIVHTLRSNVHETDALFSLSRVQQMHKLSPDETLATHRADVKFVYFTASWCGPCRSVTPVFEELARRSTAMFIKVDVDQHMDMCDRLKITSIPTVVVMRDNLEVERISADPPRLRALVTKHAP